MWELILTHLTGGACILGAGVGIFFAVNNKRRVRAVGTDPHTGERRKVTKWEYGTRRSRWRGYCVIGGTLVGYWIGGLFHILSVVQNGAPATTLVRDFLYSGAPCTAVVGLLAGLALGAVSSQYLPEKTRPPDPDAG